MPLIYTIPDLVSPDTNEGSFRMEVTTKAKCNPKLKFMNIYWLRRPNTHIQPVTSVWQTTNYESFEIESVPFWIVGKWLVDNWQTQNKIGMTIKELIPRMTLIPICLVLKRITEEMSSTAALLHYVATPVMTGNDVWIRRNTKLGELLGSNQWPNLAWLCQFSSKSWSDDAVISVLPDIWKVNRSPHSSAVVLMTCEEGASEYWLYLRTWELETWALRSRALKNSYLLFA